tara:strand:+ start:5148 stop:6146 length:999 start_codon:yes stop_codon:yes gene_type:complete
MLQEPYVEPNEYFLEKEQGETREFLEGILESLYESGDTEKLEHCLEELCYKLEIEYELKELKLTLTRNITMNELVVKESDAILADIKNTNQMCEALMCSPHYKKMGVHGVYAIVAKARSIGVSPTDALNGGMYFVQGKVEMTAGMMNQLIRQGTGHSITKDRKSDSTICILHGKRADNGDTWTESFSIDDAKLAGIYKNQWLKYPKDMLFARSLSRLARQLFPDVIKGCYVQGEISEAPALDTPIVSPAVHKDISLSPSINDETLKPEAITDEQYQVLEEWLGDNLILRGNILAFLKKEWGIETLQEMPFEIYNHALNRAMDHAQSKHEIAQ